MRLKEGGLLEIIEKKSRIKYESVIQSLKPVVKVKVLRKSLEKPARSKVHTLMFALCKGDTNEWVMEKCCELAVPNIVIWQADHSVAKIKDPEEIEKKLTRWNKICEAASKQSGNANGTQVQFYKGLKNALKNLVEQVDAETQELICCSLAPQTKELKELDIGHKNALLITGPEGDFSKEESEIIQSHNFQHVTLGPYVLRAETAAIAAISSINAIFGYRE